MTATEDQIERARWYCKLILDRHAPSAEKEDRNTCFLFLSKSKRGQTPDSKAWKRFLAMHNELFGVYHRGEAKAGDFDVLEGM